VSDWIKGLGHEYISALETYLKAGTDGDESALSRAYELGRRAMVDGLGVLDMAVLHRAAVDVLVVSAPASDQPRFARAAADFFNELLSPFEMSFRGYRGANEELRRLNESLREQKEAIEIVNRELESFSYSVSHDLRAPLRTINGYSQILLEDFADALGDDGKKCLRYVREATQHMGQLIDDLLSLARVTRTEIHRVDVDVSALARRISEQLRAASPERDGHFTIEDGVQGNGDSGLLTVLLENLLGNAWKFTSKRKQAQITFGCEERDGKPTYFVEDNGAGFDMACAAKLFGAFQRLHSVSEFEGSGIGLATVQRVVHRHDGHVWAEAKIDSGATFYFTLGGGRTA
jgi:light-regulated signal transduction histidine kinase (bacteriophytochrome)